MKCETCGKGYEMHSDDPKYPDLKLLCPKQGPGYLLGIISHIYVWKAPPQIDPAGKIVVINGIECQRVKRY